MELIIDIGNSSAKIALYDSNKVVECFCYDTLTEIEIRDLIAKFDIKSAIISTTRLADPRLERCLSEKLDRFIVFDPETTPTPLKNCYLTPRTLGADRLAAAVAAWRVFEGRKILVFDFGTAITVDLVSGQGEYMGGNISPGLDMRLRSLNLATAKLPLCSIDDYQDKMLFGNDTKSAILKGVVNGICLEIEGYISRNVDAEIFFTGGDALFFEKQIKKPIFVDYDAVLNGLHTILNYYA